jgi:hypothetical protein
MIMNLLFNNNVAKFSNKIALNEPDGLENATHNTFGKLTWIFVF